MAKNGDGLYEYDYNTRTYVYPDRLDFDKEPFATVIPNRSGSAFKVHKTEGLANGALSHHKNGAKYKQENGVWIKVWAFYEPTDCESCGVALDETRDKNTWGSGYGYNRSSWRRSPLHKGSEIFAPFLCKICFDAEQEIVEDKEKARQWRAEQKRRAEFDAKNKI